MNLQESIRRILREDDYSPAGKEIMPNKIVVHKSNPMFRDNILKDGLKAKSGECYRIYVGYGTKCKPAIFATNSTNKRAWFDSTYDDDIWEINTEMIPDVMWYKDKHYESRSKHIVTFQDIPSEVLTLKYKGKAGGIMESKNDSNKNIIKELLNDIVLPEYEHVICGFEVKEPHERFDTRGNTPFKFISVTVTFIGGPGTKLWPHTQGVQRMYDEILDEVWDVIYNYTNEGVDMYSTTIKDCGKKNIYLQETIRKVLKEETNPKKEGLLKIIKDHGLYDFTKDTGLNYNDIYHKVGEIPREVKIQYLKDAVEDLQQTPHELDLTFITGSIPLYDNDDWQTVNVEYLTNEDNVLRVHLATFDDEGGVDDFNTIREDDIDHETLDILVTELSESLQHNRN